MSPTVYVPEGVSQVDGSPGCVLSLKLELLGPPLLDRRPPEYRVQVQRDHEQVRHVGKLPLGRLERKIIFGQLQKLNLAILAKRCY